MSTQQQLDEQLARPALELIERALAEVRRMCQPGTHWNMRVPVDVEDSDVVISGALIAAKKELLARGVVPSAPPPITDEQIHAALIESPRATTVRLTDAEAVPLVRAVMVKLGLIGETYVHHTPTYLSPDAKFTWSGVPSAPSPRSDAAFQRLWTKYAALPEYVKDDWTAAFNEIWGGLSSAAAPPEPK